MPGQQSEDGRPDEPHELEGTGPEGPGTAVAADEARVTDAMPTADGAANADQVHESGVAPKSKKKRKNKTVTPPDGTLGSAKAIETVFRNAIRAELDLIALEATKANIMISLNGFIISALMISGALLFNSSPLGFHAHVHNERQQVIRQPGNSR